MARVMLRPAEYPVRASVVEEILDELAPRFEGRTVLVKPNCLMASKPEEGITTHPSVVTALVKNLEKRGARVWVGDNPGARGYGSGQHCFRESGLLEAAGENFVDLGRDTVRIAVKSRFVEHAVVSRLVMDADYVISVPKLKTHCLTLLTCAVKNMYGILAGNEKARLHYLARRGEDFAEALVDVFSIRPPDLALVDAVVAMEGDGPSRGELREVGLLLGADNAVAADAVASRLMGTDARSVRHLELAGARGFGPLTTDEIDLDGHLRPVKGYRLPSTFRTGLMSAVANRVVFNILHRSRLQVNAEECTGCGECCAACPSGAMLEAEGLYVIDPKRCHQCFCCYELCPSGAVKVRGALSGIIGGRSRTCQGGIG